MKAFIFDPLWNKIADDKIINSLTAAGIEMYVETNVAPLTEAHSLYDGNEERVLCINPDYVGWSLSSEDYATIPNLKAILILSTGYDWVDTAAANQKNIPICNIRDFSTESVAEWAILMMLNVSRRIPELIKTNFPLDFDKDYVAYKGMQIKGKTAGIVGYGNIGSAIAERCAGLGMNVVYYSRSAKESPFQAVELDELLKMSDVVFPALSNNSDTQGLLSNDRMKTMKPSALLISIAHHDLIDDKFVSELVEQGNLYGFGHEAAPGVFAAHNGNIWAAPAYAWDTHESMYGSLEKLSENILLAMNSQFPTRIN